MIQGSNDKGMSLVILLVEDNADHAELIQRSLAENRVANRIIWVDNGEKAIHYLLHQDEYLLPASSPRPNLILLDLRLPRIDGLEVLRRIRGHEELQGIPVVILTSSAAESDIARAYELNANSYIVKPLDFVKFTELLDDLGYYWLGWNKQPL
jgi:CheY-like chemotaxis protein